MDAASIGIAGIAVIITIVFGLKAKRWGYISLKFPEESKPQIFGDKTLSGNVVVAIATLTITGVTQADMGLAEAFICGDFECDDITTLLKVFIANRDLMNGLDTSTAWMTHLLDRLSHLRRANTIQGSRKNIQLHYDLGNDMFQLFLDPTMTYSCALFKDPNESLEQAQLNKLRMLIDNVGVQAGDHVLEIGSGWGSMAMELVRRTGCRVTTITLSQQQKELAETRIRANGLADRIRVELIDYRAIQGEFDHVISVEMLEAVGHAFLPTYFHSVRRLLKPGGRLGLQVITTPERSYERYRQGCDFIQKHIFPGTLCPSLGAVLAAVEEGSDLVVKRMDNIGLHYGPTLKLWREAFQRHRGALGQLGYSEEFQRKWWYYFHYCEAGFDTEYLGDYQIILTTPNYKRLSSS